MIVTNIPGLLKGICRGSQKHNVHFAGSQAGEAMRSIIAGTLRHLKMNRTLRVVELGSPKPRISDINYFVTHGNNLGTNAAATLSTYIRELVDADNHLTLYEEAYLYYLDETDTSDSATGQSTCAFPTQSRMLPRIDEGGIPNWLPPADEDESAAPAEEPSEQPTRPLLDSRWGKSRRSVEELESKQRRAVRSYAFTGTWDTFNQTR